MTGNVCLVLVDRTDLMIASSYKKSLYSYMIKKSGLWYEVGICIKVGKICWWTGPFLPEDENDNTIFRRVWHRRQELVPGERVETDKGFVGSDSLGLAFPMVQRT